MRKVRCAGIRKFHGGRREVIWGLLSVLLVVPWRVRGEEGLAPKAEWDAVYAIYNQRAVLAKHVEAAAASAALAAKYPGDKKAQIFCAQTAYYCAHRIEKDSKRKRIALAGVECAKRVLKKNPTDYDGRFWALMTTFKSKSAEGIWAALKEANKVKKVLQEMIAEEPKRPEAYMMLGTLYRELPPLLTWGDAKKGVELLEEAARLAPHDPEILLELAAAYAKVGRKEEAKAAYRKCINDSKAPPDRSWETEDARAYAKKKLNELEE